MRKLKLAVLTLVLCAPSLPAFAQMSDSDMVVRIEQLENQLRQVTGQVEQLQFRNRQLEQQLRQAQPDTDNRIAGAAPPPGARPLLQNRPTALPGAVAQQQPQYQQAAPQDQGQPQPRYQGQPPQPQYQGQPQYQQPAPGRRSDVFDPSQNPNAPGAPRTLGNPSVAAAPDAQIMNDEEDAPPIGAPGGRRPGAPLDLSTLSAPGEGDAVPRQGPPPPSPGYRPPPGTLATLPPSQTPRDEFDLAYGYIQRKDYALAEDGFRSFMSKYPSDRMVPDAQYWIGESLFQRQRYKDAAESFLNVATKYETAGKAPEALLRLGQSLAAMGNKETACATFGEVLRKYPRASVGVRQGADREQKRVKC